MTTRTFTLLLVALVVAPQAAAYVVINAGWAGLVLLALMLMVCAGVLGGLVCWRALSAPVYTGSAQTSGGAHTPSETISTARRG